MACEALQLLERSTKLLRLLSPESQKWWKKHKQADAQRQEREDQEKRDKFNRQKALNKLTPAERKLLAVD